MADDELDLDLRLGSPPPLPPVALIAQAPALAEPLIWPQTLRRPSRPNAKLLITQFLNMRLNGFYHLVPPNLRNEIIELGENNFFALNHNAMMDEFYFCHSSAPHEHPPAPWIRREGPRKVYTNGNRILIGRFVTYGFGETQLKVTRYTSSVQELASFIFRDPTSPSTGSEKGMRIDFEGELESAFDQVGYYDEVVSLIVYAKSLHF